MRLPDTAIEAAALAIGDVQFGGVDDFGRLPERIQDELLKEARAALTAFCESVGFQEERRHFPHKGECERLTSRWRPVEGEDPK